MRKSEIRIVVGVVYLLMVVLAATFLLVVFLCSLGMPTG